VGLEDVAGQSHMAKGCLGWIYRYLRTISQDVA
jgi:hypothetical protein